MITQYDHVMTELVRYQTEQDKAEAEEQAFERFLDDHYFDEIMTQDQIREVLIQVWEGEEGNARTIMETAAQQAFEREKRRDEEFTVEAQAERMARYQ